MAGAGLATLSASVNGLHPIGFGVVPFTYYVVELEAAVFMTHVADEAWEGTKLLVELVLGMCLDRPFYKFTHVTPYLGLLAHQTFPMVVAGLRECV